MNSVPEQRKIILIRHGQTDWNAIGKIQGQEDIPLNDLGRMQAERLRNSFKFKPCSKIITSDSSRAIETAKILSQNFPSVKIISDTRLRERNYGLWQGYTWEYIHSTFPHLIAEKNRNPYLFTPPEGENVAMMEKRIVCFLSDLEQEFRNDRELTEIVVISHNSPLKMIMTLANNEEIGKYSSYPHLKNVEVFEIIIDFESSRVFQLSEESYKKWQFNSIQHGSLVI